MLYLELCFGLKSTGAVFKEAQVAWEATALDLIPRFQLVILPDITIATVAVAVERPAFGQLQIAALAVAVEWPAFGQLQIAALVEVVVAV